ncbi:helix-turn-helix domain containing protein [Rhodococcus opacus]|uniref:Helix-turn-helix domain-containing protein n=1 Tax=Rhodococcus opacus TaxID=37919 RepID=A0AAX3YSB0_RHOOP|nr:TetR/AcrR family transcriptional regulator [Rhodococcus opacus]MCZ4587615.1 helix-turn-helix domain containing protein [Rhodococcus opacus]WLF51390.1 helix-turn-helix domain-containing protein [Rhodococcus opacus]
MVSTEQVSTRRDRKRLETRERLYESAVELFVERGYDATTMDDIAEKADTARRTAFNHFPTKGDIAIEWANRRRVRAAQAARAEGSDDGSLFDRLHVYFRELAAITEESPTETRQMTLGWLSAQGPVFNRTWLPQELHSWLDTGKRGGDVERDTNTAAASEVLYDVYQGALFRWMGEKDPEPGRFTQELDTAIGLVLSGIQTARGARAR